MRKKAGLSTILSMIAVVLAVFTTYVSLRHQHKIAYVLVTDVFNEFEMKKEMEKKYTLTRDARKKILDSIQIDLSVLAGRIKMNKATEEDKNMFDRKRMEYNQKMQLFDEDNASMSKQLDEQIIKQLNQYVQDFGKQYKYDIIYGNTSNGSIMYGTDELNVTKEVITFINGKYKGLN